MNCNRGRDAEKLTDLLRNLALFLLLELLLGRTLVFLVWDVLKQGNFTQLVPVLVDNMAVVVDGLAHARKQVALGELANNVAVLVTDLTLLVDAQAGHRANLTLLLFGLPSLCVTDDVAVLVGNVTIIIDFASHKVCNFTLSDAANDVTGTIDNGAVLLDGG